MPSYLLQNINQGFIGRVFFIEVDRTISYIINYVGSYGWHGTSVGNQDTNVYAIEEQITKQNKSVHLSPEIR